MLVTYSLFSSLSVLLQLPKKNSLAQDTLLSAPSPSLSFSMEPERHTCRLCNRNFRCGRALGGHMRSHMTTMSPPRKIQSQAKLDFSEEEEQEEVEEEVEDEEVEFEEGKALGYGLRENPRKSFRLADPEFSFMVDAGSVVQDSQSETEFTGGHFRNPARRRSKRRKSSASVENEPEPVSSVSDTTPEEDVALCLMMLSRDVRQPDSGRSEDSDDTDGFGFRKRSRGKYQCCTCKKIFQSYQALGGHRASHKKIKGCSAKVQEADSDAVIVGFSGDQKVHECPVCFKVFASGQALGGHKRSHLSAAKLGSMGMGDNLLDLNLPAPLDEDEFSQVELSAVSDAELIDPAK